MDSFKKSRQLRPIPNEQPGRTRKRQANLYDAVAGRVTTTRQLASSTVCSKSRGGAYGLRDTTMAPQEVLFQRRGAPQRYAEKDIYHSQHEALPPATRDSLPDSDMLKAVHGYAAAFYEQLAVPGPAQDAKKLRADCFVGTRHVDERSMDETALIAFGILLQEAGREALGRRGDLVFTEGLVEEEEEGLGTTSRRDRSRSRSVGVVGGGSVHSGEDDVFWRRRYPKRRKMGYDAGR